MSLADDIINRVRATLFDQGKTRWSDSELLNSITDAQRQVVLLKPSAFVVNSSVQLAQGVIQSIPADGVQLIDITANMGTDGVTPGGAITQIDRTELDAYIPGWRNSTASDVARHYIYDDRDPKRFEIYPPQPATPGYVQMSYSASPPVVTAVSSQLSLSDIYDTVIYYLVLVRCFSKSSSTQDLNKAAGYQNAAVQLITGKKQAMMEMHPEQPQERVKQ